MALVCGLLVSSAAIAAPAWVTDQFEITLRSGPSTSNAIQLMIDSGLRLEVLERDARSRRGVAAATSTGLPGLSGLCDHRAPELEEPDDADRHQG